MLVWKRFILYNSDHTRKKENYINSGQLSGCQDFGGARLVSEAQRICSVMKLCCNCDLDCDIYVLVNTRHHAMSKLIELCSKE
jgi:hypothetical protein